jgi:uncharacterized protein YjbI with pentapeptide repeats/beta-lactamase regulating signal transducer with metallopeptidase domain
VSASMLQQLAAAAGAVTAIAINALWEDALLVICVWLLLRAWPGLNAATRYMVWSATLIATVVVPVATTLPFLTSASPATAVNETAVRATIPMVTHALTAVAPAEPKPVPHATHAAQAAQPAAAATTFAPRLPERFRMTLPLPLTLGVLAVWALLALLSLARLAIGLLRLEGLKRDALPLPVEYRDAMLRWTEVNKGSRQVRLCVSDDIDVPVAVGLFDSMILIPRALLERLSEDEVDQISLHELAHLRRADDWSNGLQRLIIALFAWNPAVLFVGQQLDLEREVACDDRVLELTGRVRPYALCLTKMAETSSWPYRPMPAPGVFATRKHISLRIERLLGAGRNAATNLSLGPAAATVAIVAALAFAMELVAPSVAASVDAPSVAKNKQLIRYVILSDHATAGGTATTTAAQPQAGKSTIVADVEMRKTVAQNAPAPVPAASAAPGIVHVPATHVHIPAKTMHLPAINVDVPAMTLPIPQLSHLAKLHLAQSAMAQGMRTAAAAGASASAAAASAAASSVGVGLSGMHLAQASTAHACNGCDMSHVDWAGRDMRGVNYTGVDLSRSNLQNTNFAGGTFNGVDFTGANLRGASFRNAKLIGCDFSRADLSGVDFTGATIQGCQFTSAQLPSAQIRAVLNTCTGCDFSHANLAGQDLTNVHANGIDFSGANLSGVNFSGSQFTGVDFTGAAMGGVNLTNVTLNGCDLSGVDLSHVDLSHAKLIGTDLSGDGKPHQ